MSVVRHLIPVLTGFVLLGALQWSCGDECQYDRDCPPFEVCHEGACRPLGSIDGGADGDSDTDTDADSDTDSDSDTDADTDSDSDADAEGQYTALSLTQFELTGELLCDVSGDGLPDNVFADLDPTIMAFLRSWIDDAVHRWNRVLAVDLGGLPDPATPEGQDVVVTMGTATDCDGDPSDNTSPGELIAPTGDMIDFTVSVSTGALVGEADRMVFNIDDGDFVLSGFEFTATVAPWLESLSDGVLCFYFAIPDLYGLTTDSYPDYTVLDALVAPGAVSGLTWITGLQPDVDVDGDGLETLIADEDGHVVQCLDGDGSTVVPEEGHHCAEHPGIVDGFSGTFLVAGVGAVMAASCPGGDSGP